MKKIGIFGSTGHIGETALGVIKNNKFLAVDSLVAYCNADKLIMQAKQYAPALIGLLNEKFYDKEKFSVLKNVEVTVGKEAYSACLDSDTVLFSASSCDLFSLMKLIEAGKTIALSNKECMVSAGELIMTKAKQCGAKIIPVDSEHSAIWQCLKAGKRREVEKIILTASGGAFYDYSYEQLATVTPMQAINHPIWDMGKKISVDSATMMNKALELIEARWLFGTKNVGYIIHPQSIIHSMVLFKDGSTIAQLALPDMAVPISLALCGKREKTIKPFEFDRSLTFLPPREDVFFGPKLAMECIKTGGTAGAVLDAADEGAVDLFLNGRIPFTRIAEIVRDTLERTEISDKYTLSGITELHDEVKNRVMRENQ